MILGKLTSCAVKVGEVEHISGTADWAARCAKVSLALVLERSSEGSDGESEDGGVKHVDGLDGEYCVGVKWLWLLVVVDENVS